MNEIATKPNYDEALGVSKYGTDEAFTKVSDTSSWLPRLQLFGSNSDLVKQGKFPMAHWGLVHQKDQVDDLGPEVDMIPFSWRPKAMNLSGDSPVSFFNHESPEFKDIQIKSETPNSKCVVGPEFLIWIPKLECFAAYFMGSKTARRESEKVRTLMKRGCTLGCHLIETNKYSWHGPTARRCATELSGPKVEDLKRIAEVFDNPEDSTIEFDPQKIEEAAAASDRPR